MCETVAMIMNDIIRSTLNNASDYRANALTD